MRVENRALVGPDDVVLAAHPGSGASWIGTLLVNLGIFYVSGDDELLVDGGQRTSDVVRSAVKGQLSRLPVLRDRDQNPHWREPLRVIKTNGSRLQWAPPGRVILLVRDGRDALLSLYHHRVGFSGLDVSLLDFLTGTDGVPPAASWGFACSSWLGTPSEQLLVLRFETCRERPLEEFRRLMDFLAVSRTDAEIEAAIEASSYGAMRRQEDALVEGGGARIMRKGKVGEWRDVYTPPMLATFSGMPRRTLQALGYPVDSVP